jgi:hypothetical protein
MTTATEITESVQEGVLKAIETTQRWTLEAFRTAASTFESLVPNRPSLPLADKLPEPKEAVDSGFDFAEKVLASHRSFATELASIGSPATRPVAARKAPTAS